MATAVVDGANSSAERPESEIPIPTIIGDFSLSPLCGLLGFGFWFMVSQKKIK